ncbi:MAG: acyl-CoA dehydratase activase [Candidatus Sabulitectum sp.]|nr:acyl-CoA dehydratase activase [Candidatus Sabulitectum sp.]
MNRTIAGIDIGSVAIKVAFLKDRKILRSIYRRHQGKPVESLLRLFTEYPELSSTPAVLTGTGSSNIAGFTGTEAVNEVVALAASISEFLPDTGSVIEMGGQDSKLLLMRRDAAGETVMDEFAMNSICAAGTGSFLDQQAGRLGLTPEEMGDLAVTCDVPPRIAGRCSVFAKSDMIHLQQIGATVAEIVSGLCFAVARNFRSVIAAGRRFRYPVVFVGGVAANRGMVKAFESVLEGQVTVPENFSVLTAAGAALSKKPGILTAGQIQELINSTGTGIETLPSLKPFALSKADFRATEKLPGEGIYLGIDVGSISTNLAAVSPDGKIVDRLYLRTAGKPLEAVKNGLRTMGPKLQSVPVLGVGVTGSGRYMTGDFVGADVVRNEISAQARAAIEIDPEVDTVFEIGGQDSKYISIHNGRVVDFEMNKVCAAGTGSFLEEQAEKLGVKIEDFGLMALSAADPCRLGERCTVFMESDVVSHQAVSTPVQQITSGLCYSIVRNYLHRVVGERKIGEKVFFQGGTAHNQGVVAAFNSVLGEGREVILPPHHDVTGAIGVALMARDSMKENQKTSFRGWSLSENSYTQDSFVCKACPNDCEIHRVTLEDGTKLLYGGRCEKYETGSMQITPGGENLFKERVENLFKNSGEEWGNGPAVGIARSLWFWELFPFFGTFFRSMGCRVVVSDESTSATVHSGVESVAAETCFPVKIAHGHVMELLDRGVEILFLPSILRNKPQGNFSESYNCPYVQGSPYILDAGLVLNQMRNVKVLKPILDFSLPGDEWMSTLIETAIELGFSTADAKRALKAAELAQTKFTEINREIGARAIRNLNGRRGFVIVSRPYNGSDPVVNTDLPAKLAKLGGVVIPLDMLPMSMERAAEGYSNMYWHYGQRILAGGIEIKENENLHAVYISNFGCGPDSFIEHSFKEIMGEKPYLAIEIDEHAADAGVITRCEAFLDALDGAGNTGTEVYQPPAHKTEDITGRTLWIPLMSEAAYLAAATVRNRGLDARVIPPTTAEAVALGRTVTTGRECYPAIITAGNMLKILETDEPEKTAFFMATASGPCRFGRYCNFHRQVLEKTGYTGVPVLTATSSDSYSEIPGLGTRKFQKDFLQSLAAADVLKRALFRIRPYEITPGSADNLFSKWLGEFEKALEEGNPLSVQAKKAAAEFNKFHTKDIPRKPLVAVFGEIYVRNDDYANDNTIRKLEALGAEVIYTPLTEWFDYVNHSYIEKSRQNRKTASVIKGKAIGMVITKVKRAVEKPFDNLLNGTPHVSASQIMKASTPYMAENIGGEAVLSIGAPIALLEHGGIDGAVNVYPFNCLPGTIVSAISRRIKRDKPGLPWLNLAFDGQEDTDNTSRFEAFMDQVRRLHHGKTKKWRE